MKLTRRELAAALASTAAAAQSSPPPSTPQEELKAAQDRNRNTAEALAKMAVPMATEPAFQFKA
jgi:hypothetical protein